MGGVKFKWLRGRMCDWCSEWYVPHERPGSNNAHCSKTCADIQAEVMVGANADAADARRKTRIPLKKRSKLRGDKIAEKMDNGTAEYQARKRREKNRSKK